MVSTWWRQYGLHVVGFNGERFGSKRAARLGPCCFAIPYVFSSVRKRSHLGVLQIPLFVALHGLKSIMYGTDLTY